MKRLKKTERMSPGLRKDALISATLKCLSTEGHEGLSIRKISAEAGVAVGLINHHYANKEDLVAQAYEHLTLSHLEVVKAAVAAADPDARSQLSAFLHAMLTPPVLDPAALRAWVVFWGMMERGNALGEVFDRTYGDYRRFLEGILGRLAVDSGMHLLDTNLTTIGLLALLDGLWIAGNLDPDSCSSEDAIRLAEAWVDALVQGNTRTVRPGIERPVEKMV